MHDYSKTEGALKIGDLFKSRSYNNHLLIMYNMRDTVRAFSPCYNLIFSLKQGGRHCNYCTLQVILAYGQTKQLLRVTQNGI